MDRGAAARPQAGRSRLPQLRPPDPRRSARGQRARVRARRRPGDRRDGQPHGHDGPGARTRSDGHRRCRPRRPGNPRDRPPGVRPPHQPGDLSRPAGQRVQAGAGHVRRGCGPPGRLHRGRPRRRGRRAAGRGRAGHRAAEGLRRARDEDGRDHQARAVDAQGAGDLRAVYSSRLSPRRRCSRSARGRPRGPSDPRRSPSTI